MSVKTNRFKIARSFGSASTSYDISARLQRYCGKHLMPWLPNRNDLTALDLGAGTGFFTELLASRYQYVIGLDISKKMLNFSKENRNQSIHWLEADAYKIPLQDNSIDLVYSNLMIQWCDPLDLVLNEVMRVLKPGGLFVFSTLIDGTLFELKSAWAQVDNDQHVIDFKKESDIRPLFDGTDRKLLNAKQQDIVLEYENVLHLAHELKSLGANHVPKKQAKGLAGKDKWQKMTKSYQDFIEPSGIYPATYKAFSGLVVKLNN
ncbi:malonyl-ACP O-methyltransferase BioC [Cognaticolwellia beringensis]|uniref:Malonyl-[acyl-carrier protein] O-methyltransferase n=1 Tax=Cognaticolwellia beringensis TaxID=1967665 RepID=A0A222GBW4_9GAMM|nr:malonyl-ACP O-methyltransferase BioC [Cognaticolwellia beringensis]ASP49385.1 malonyl-[acyl-carrier protein] O-methyltransferase BioC [Cognaticolwellia beringensis]